MVCGHVSIGCWSRARFTTGLALGLAFTMIGGGMIGLRRVLELELLTTTTGGGGVGGIGDNSVLGSATDVLTSTLSTSSV